MSGRRQPAAITALGLAALFAGCTAASRIEDRTFYSAKGYTVKLPDQGWRVQSGGLADLELRRDTPPGGMLTDATCEGVEPSRPLNVLVRHLTFGLTDRETVESDTRTVGGRPVAHTLVRGLIDGAPVEVEAVVLKADRCVHDFVYVAPAGTFESGRLDFQTFVESFATGAAPR